MPRHHASVERWDGGHGAARVRAKDMTALRALIMVLMAALMLPLGGMAAAYAAHQPPAVQQAEATQIVAQRKCRGSFLPGWPCGQDKFMQAVAVLMAPAGAWVPGWLLQDWHHVGLAHAPPRQPPRGV